MVFSVSYFFLEELAWLVYFKLYIFTLQQEQN